MLINSTPHQVRRIAKLGLETPLLIPSFSSRGFPNVAAIIEILAVDISRACLLSAFDLVHGHAPIAFEKVADIVVVDSGVYETSPTAVAVDTYLPAASTALWTRDSYRSFLGIVADRVSATNAVIVSFDAYTSVETQVEMARADFTLVRSAATDFLLKPEVPGEIHRVFPSLGDKFGLFDVIGVTERELGRSALERCRALLRLRASLDAAGLSMPIHVFGSITPAAVTAYFLCGADIFDGLNWLRVGLDGAWVGAPSEFAVTSLLFKADDNAVLLELWRRNLSMLHRTQTALRRFAVDGDRDSLRVALPFADASLALANAAIR